MPRAAYNPDEQQPAPPYKASPLPKLITIGVILFVAMILVFFNVDYVKIHGNELGIKETWTEGVVNQVYPPKYYLLGPGSKMYAYDASVQVYEMKGENAYKVQSSEGQDMTIALNLRWRIDPAKLVDIHKTVRTEIPDKLIRPTVMRVVKDEATRLRAIDAYSGEGLVKLQAAIQSDLTGAGNEGQELAKRGIIVENFVIEHIELDPNYIAEIKLKQIATQRQLRLVEEQKAADADALVAKAKAQSDLNKQVVEAQRDKEVTVLTAEAANEKIILAAKAEQQKLILEAEGNKEKMILEAAGTLAKGQAEAQAKKLLLEAWAVPGAESFVKVEIAKSLADGFKNIQGYLPGNISINTLSGNFMEALSTITQSVPPNKPQPVGVKQ